MHSANAGISAPQPGLNRSRRTSTPIAPHAASVGLPLRFVLLGLTCLLTGIGLLVMRPDILATYHYNQYVIAATHLFVLGWITSIIMGSMYQLVPVALEADLYSEPLAKWHFAFHLVGVAGMVGTFWRWNVEWVGYFGVVFGIGVLLFIYNIGRTLARIPRWNVIAASVASSLGWLLLTMLAGLFLAAAKRWNINIFSPIAQMHAHAHLGVVGFVLIILVGVSYKLAPMFMLSEIQGDRRTWWSIGLLNVGLAGAFAGIALERNWKFGFSLLMAAGLVVYGVEMLAIVRARKRRSIDWGIRYFLTALGLIAPVALAGLVLGWPTLPLTALTGQLENVYGFLALIGIVTFAMLGMLYKIVPFLVWYSRYSREIGRAKVPALADLYSHRLQAWGYWTYILGLGTVSVAALLSHQPAVFWGCLALTLSLGIFTCNMGLILRHMIQPSVEPLPSKQPAAHPASA